MRGSWTLTIRPGARYFTSLELLHRAKRLDSNVFTKSGLMVGLGESREEVHQVMDEIGIIGRIEYEGLGTPHAGSTGPGPGAHGRHWMIRKQVLDPIDRVQIGSVQLAFSGIPDLKSGEV